MKHTHLRTLICTALIFGASAIPARAQFVSDFGVSKTGYYDQTGDTTPVLEPVNNHEFFAWVTDSGQSEIEEATVGLPGGLGQINLMPFLYYFDDFSSQAAMDSQFKNGTYRFSVTSVDFDVLFQDVNLSGNAYPSIPQLQNFAALQSINASANLTLQWLPFQGGTTGDDISIFIDGDTDTVFSARVDGTTTSVVVPAATLTSGATYDVYLTFNKIVDINSNDGTGEAVYVRETSATIKTSAGGVITVGITGYSLTPTGTFQVQVAGTPGATFSLDATTDFAGWTQVASDTPSNGITALTDPDAASHPNRFYRVKAM